MPITSHNLIAAGYQLLEPSVVQPSPPQGPEVTTNLSTYLNGAYVTMYMIIIVAAVFFLVKSGVLYMISNVPALKINAKDKIWKVFWGIMLALSAYLLLQTINPDLLNLNLILP